MRTPRQIPCSSEDEDWNTCPDLTNMEVYDEEYPQCSSLLDQYGNPIPYRSPKQGFMGFRRLR